MAWTCRCGFNCAVLHALTWRALPDSFRAIMKNAAMLTMGILTLAGTVLLPEAIAPRVAYMVVALIAAAAFTWFCVMSAEERRELIPVSNFS
jgi:hypothetical protein